VSKSIVIERFSTSVDGFVFNAAPMVLSCAVGGVAVRCNALQCDAVCCSVLKCVVVDKSAALLMGPVFYAATMVTSCVAVRCSALQCDAVCCSVLMRSHRNYVS